MSRFSAFVSSVRFNAYGQVLQLALPFFLVPFMVHRLGTESYGLYLLIGIATSQMAHLGLGTTPAAVKYLAEFSASGDNRSLRALLGTALAFFGAVGLAGGCVLAALAAFLPGRWLRVGPELLPEARFMLLCAAPIFLLQSLARPLQSVPQALQNFAAWNALESSVYALQALGIFALLGAGFGLRAVVAWNIAAAAILLAAYAAALPRLLPDALPGRPERAMLGRLLGMGIPLFLAQFCWSILHQADKVVLGHFIPMDDLALYIIAFNLAQKLLACMGPIAPILIPLYSALSGTRDDAAVLKVYLGGMKFTVMAVWPATVLLFLLAPAFLDLWLGPGSGLRAGWLTRWLALGVFFNSLTTFPNTLSQGLGNVRPPMTAYCALVLAAAAAWPWILPRGGAAAAALAFLGVQALYAAFFLGWCHARLLRIPNAAALKQLAAPALLFLPQSAFCCAVRNRVTSWPALTACVAACGISYAAACLAWGLDSAQRQRLREAFGRAKAGAPA